MAVSSILRLLLAAAAVVSSTPIRNQNLVERGTVDPNNIVGFPQTVPSGTEGDLMLAYQPYLKIFDGCVPFPAVDEAGDTNAGSTFLSSFTDEDCSSNTGQIYARASTWGNYYAIMYAWYFPKDEFIKNVGHAHAWESAIVWLTSNSSTTAANIVAVCPSVFGAWDCSTTAFTRDGTQPLIGSDDNSEKGHYAELTSTVGGTQPLIAWESLPAVAQAALEQTDFSPAFVPFIDVNFDRALIAATF